MSRRTPNASASTSAMIVGSVMMGIVIVYFVIADSLNISTTDDNIINRLFPYVLFVGIAFFGLGIAIKAYHWKKS